MTADPASSRPTRTSARPVALASGLVGLSLLSLAWPVATLGALAVLVLAVGEVRRPQTRANRALLLGSIGLGLLALALAVLATIAMSTAGTGRG